MQSRRQFIALSAMALPALSLASMLLSACGKAVETPGTKPRIGIIGAGLAGLQAAKVLAEQMPCEIEILEAGDRIGGRVHTLDNVFGAFDLELGAAATYGVNAFSQLIQPGQRSDSDPVNDAAYFIDGNSYSSAAMQSDADFMQLQSSWQNMNLYKGSSELTLSEYIEQSAVPERVRFLFRERAEMLCGTGIARASLIHSVAEALPYDGLTRSHAGSTGFHRVLLNAYSGILPYVLSNTAVAAIDYSGEQILVSDRQQVQRRYDRVLISVPVSVLQMPASNPEHIAFTPTLPAAKRDAIEQMGMDAATRIVLRLKRRFWNHGIKSFYSDGPIGRFDVLSENLLSNQFVVAATVYGTAAEALAQQSDAEIAAAIEADWLKSIGTIALNSITAQLVKHWSKEPGIRGGFSHLKPGSDAGARATLAEAVNGKLYFAGEACHTGNKSGTLHGAVETGNSAAAAIIQSFK